jgi:hypothetical protein
MERRIFLLTAGLFQSRMLPTSISYSIAFRTEDRMSGIRNVFLLMVCIGSNIVLPWNSAVGQGSGSERVSAPMSPAAAVVSGISVSREESTSHLRVEVCGPDGTRLRHGFPLVFELNAPVRGIVVRNGDMGMAVGATAAGPRATVTLSRDPFMPPQPWRVVVLLSVEGNLGEGHIVVGAMRFPLPTPLPPRHATVVLGTGCDERYAGQGAPLEGRQTYRHLFFYQEGGFLHIGHTQQIATASYVQPDNGHISVHTSP